MRASLPWPGTPSPASYLDGGSVSSIQASSIRETSYPGLSFLFPTHENDFLVSVCSLSEELLLQAQVHEAQALNVTSSKGHCDVFL